MKIALFSDIHANLPALEACLLSIDAQNPDAVYCLGDLVGYNFWPNEVVNEIRKRKIPCIAGNYDFGVGLNSNDCGCAYKTDDDKKRGEVSIAYTNSLMGEQERTYLKSLPAHIRLEYKFENKLFTILLVHGSPRRINEYLFEDREEAGLLRIMEDAGAQILCFGHTHKPYHRILGDVDNKRHAINIGSVGKPKDGNAQGCYVLLTIDTSDMQNKMPGVQVKFVRFDYDIERAVAAIEASPLPNEFALMLQSGT